MNVVGLLWVPAEDKGKAARIRDARQELPVSRCGVMRRDVDVCALSQRSAEQRDEAGIRRGRQDCAIARDYQRIDLDDDVTGRPGTGGSLISPSLDTGFTYEEPLPDNAWEQYVELHYGDEAAIDSNWSQSDGTGSDNENQSLDDNGQNNDKDTGPTT